jgi:DNA-binding MarR family transcriptional regulator
LPPVSDTHGRGRSGQRQGAPYEDPNYLLESTLHAVSRSLARAYDNQFRELGLSRSQAGVLLQVDPDTPFTQTEIARRLGIGKAAAGALIIELENQGLLMRRRHADDARMIEVTLTKAGRRKADRVMEFVARIAPLLREGMAQAELDAAVAVLEKLQANATRLLDAADAESA